MKLRRQKSEGNWVHSYSIGEDGEQLIWHVHIWISFNYNDYAICRVAFSHHIS